MGSTDESTETTDTAELPCNAALAVQPILRLKFEGDASNEGTLSAAYDGTENGVSYVEGKCGQAVSFAGEQGAEVVIANTAAPLSASTDYTLGMWFREDVEQQGNILNFRATEADMGGGLHVFDGASDDLTTCASVTVGGTTGGCRSVPYTLQQWHHLLYRCDGDAANGCDLQIFVDGELMQTIPQMGRVIFSINQAPDLTLGGGTSVFIIDDFRVYDQVFSTEENCTEVIGGTFAAGMCSLPDY